MKNAMLATGAALLLAVLLSSPTFAQTAKPPLNAAPAPAPAAVEQPAADVPIDALIETASTPEDRIALLRRCAGPPPRPMPAKDVAKTEPMSEPAVITQ
ncbi:MAG: hypothetical protein QM773_09605 [Hyphomonadaceae bacterium]